MGVSNSQLADLIATTLEDLPQGQFEIMWDNHDSEMVRLYQEHRRQVDGGTSIQRNVMLDRSGRAKYRRLFDTDNPTVDNQQKTINVPWTQVGTSYSWDKLEIMRNKSSRKGFINLLESRRAERMWDISQLIEERGWLTPNNSTDDLHPYGIPYYVNYLDEGVTTGGFQGKTVRYQDGSTSTVVAGLDGGLEPKWRNYADTYTNIDNGFLRKTRQAIRRTRFRPSPIAIKPGMDNVGSPIKFYGNDDTVTELEHLADLRDDNNTPTDLMGKVMHNFDGSVMINRIPVKYIDQLDGVTVTGSSDTVNTVDPLYCVDWTKLQPIVQDGYWMIESEPMTNSGQHTVFTVYLDGAHQNLCINRRTAGFVMHKPIVA